MILFVSSSQVSSFVPFFRTAQMSQNKQQTKTCYFLSVYMIDFVISYTVLDRTIQLFCTRNLCCIFQGSCKTYRLKVHVVQALIIGGWMLSNQVKASWAVFDGLLGSGIKRKLRYLFMFEFIASSDLWNCVQWSFNCNICKVVHIRSSMVHNYGALMMLISLIAKPWLYKVMKF